MANRSNGAGWFIIGVPTFVISLCLLILSSQANAQFREQRSWQFEDPVTKAIKLQRAQSRQLYKGGFFDGSHAPKYLHIGEINVDEANGNLHLIDQSNTSIGNYQNISQDGNGNLTVDSEATSGEQTNSNSAVRDNSPSCLNCGGGGT